MLGAPREQRNGLLHAIKVHFCARAVQRAKPYNLLRRGERPATPVLSLFRAHPTASGAALAHAHVYIKPYRFCDVLYDLALLFIWNAPRGARAQGHKNMCETCVVVHIQLSENESNLKLNILCGGCITFCDFACVVT